MRNIIFILVMLFVLSCSFVLNPWIWSNDGTIVDHPHVAATPPPPDQRLASAPPSSASALPVKVAAVAHSVHSIPRRSGGLSTDPSGEETVAFVVSSPYHPHWVIEW